MLIYYRKKKGAMEYAFSCGLFDIFLYFQHCFGGKGGRKWQYSRKQIKNRKVQRKMLGVSSNFGSDCSMDCDNSYISKSARLKKC